MSADGGDFVTGGNLGYMNFPPVDGGKGDPSNTVGNPGQYLSISSKATRRGRRRPPRSSSPPRCSPTPRSRSGSTPARADRQGHREPARAPPKDADFLEFVYDIASNAKVFAQSWDQALSPTAAETLLDNIAKLFQLSISPQQFADNMNEVIGQ